MESQHQHNQRDKLPENVPRVRLVLLPISFGAIHIENYFEHQRQLEIDRLPQLSSM
jgi:hypothetical protein